MGLKFFNFFSLLLFLLKFEVCKRERERIENEKERDE